MGAAGAVPLIHSILFLVSVRILVLKVKPSSCLNSPPASVLVAEQVDGHVRAVQHDGDLPGSRVRGDHPLQVRQRVRLPDQLGHPAGGGQHLREDAGGHLQRPVDTALVYPEHGGQLGLGGPSILAYERQQQGVPNVQPGAVVRIQRPDIIVPEERRVPVCLYPGGVPVQDVVELLGGAERDGAQSALVYDDVVQNGEPGHVDVPLGLVHTVCRILALRCGAR